MQPSNRLEILIVSKHDPTSIKRISQDGLEGLGFERLVAKRRQALVRDYLQHLSLSIFAGCHEFKRMSNQRRTFFVRNNVCVFSTFDISVPDRSTPWKAACEYRQTALREYVGRCFLLTKSQLGSIDRNGLVLLVALEELTANLSQRTALPIRPASVSTVFAPSLRQLCV